MKKIIIIATFLALLFSGCIGGGSDKEEWTSLIYPNKENTKRSKKHGVFKTLEKCRKSSLQELEKMNLSTKGSYQCGLNCNYHEGMKLDICERLDK